MKKSPTNRSLFLKSITSGYFACFLLCYMCLFCTSLFVMLPKYLTVSTLFEFTFLLWTYLLFLCENDLFCNNCSWLFHAFHCHQTQNSLAALFILEFIRCIIIMPAVHDYDITNMAMKMYPTNNIATISILMIRIEMRISQMSSWKKVVFLHKFYKSSILV